jgi:purine catabolism regulator
VGEVGDLAGLLRGGELILSTGIAMSGPVTEAVGYLEALITAGAAGLVVELGERFPAVPDEVLAAARTRDFPVVVLRHQVRFVEVTEEVHRGIVAEQLEQVEFAREVHERFTTLSLEEADAAAIVAATSALSRSSVVLEDLTRRVVAFEARGRPEAGLLADWERRSRATPALETPGVSGPEGWVTAPVGLHGRRWARLVVPDPATSQARLAMLLERAAQALELGRMVERDRLSLEHRAQGGLLADLAGGRVGDEESASARAVALGLRRGAWYVGVVARPRAGPADPPGGTDPLLEQDRARTLVEQVSRALRSAGLSALVGSLVGDQVGLLLAVPPATTRAPHEDRTLDTLAARLPPGEVVLGVGPVSRSVLGAGRALGQAAHIAEVAAGMPGPLDRVWFRHADIGLRGLLALLHDDARVQAFVESELGRLLEHEARRSDGSLHLLRQYVAVGGNKTRLAEATHRSRASVYKRLDRLSRLLGADLDDPAALMSLGVALLAYDSRSA